MEKETLQTSCYLSLIAAFLLLCHPEPVVSQQAPDTTFRFAIRQTAYEPGQGPLILIDGAHNNFHTKPGGFYAFCTLMEQDGYRTAGLTGPVTNAGMLRECRILVIANALNPVNAESWTLPTPSAFTPEEITVLRQWVRDGGSLLLIADHMPFAGAASDLAAAFGFGFLNGFAITGEQSWPPTCFSRTNHMLLSSPPVDGMQADEKIDSVATFTGSAFAIPAGAAGILRFEAGKSLQPDTAWKFNDKTPAVNLKEYFQGAILEYGKGRIAVFGEAAMFTAQVVNGTFKVGFNSETAPQNARFALNLIHWLDHRGIRAGRVH